jgi:hypothetical protein
MGQQILYIRMKISRFFFIVENDQMVLMIDLESGRQVDSVKASRKPFDPNVPGSVFFHIFSQGLYDAVFEIWLK